MLGPMAQAANHADQSLRPQCHGSAGAQLFEAEHAGLSLQDGWCRGRRHVEERDDRMVKCGVLGARCFGRLALPFLTTLASCATQTAASGPSSQHPAPSTSWSDSVLRTLSDHDK